MRERPMEFRINYDAPLAEGLVFAGLGGHGCIGSMVYPDSSLYANHGRLVNMDAATDWVWDTELRRCALQTEIAASLQYAAIPMGGGLDGRSVYTIVSFARWIGTQDAGYEDYGHLCARQKDKRFSNNVVGIRSADPSVGCIYIAPFSYSDDRVNGSTPVGNNRWRHVAITVMKPAVQIFLDGVVDGNGYTNLVPSSDPTVPLSIGAWYGDGAGQMNGTIADFMTYSRGLSDAEISALADPSNVDLRVGGVPLILPPRRRFWPVVSEQAIPKMVPWHLFQQVSA